MAKGSRQHSSSEFGKTGSSSISGLDAPMIGAGAAITVDGIVERESGVTPPPPPVSVKVLVIVFAVIFVLGLIGMVLLYQVVPHGTPYSPSISGGATTPVQQARSAVATTARGASPTMKPARS